MIDSILRGLKEQVGQEILSKTDVKSSQLGNILSVIGDATKTEVKKSMVNDGLSTVMNLFSNKENSSQSNQLQSGISSSIVSGLISKLGLSPSTSKMISEIAVPILMDLITRKNSETPDDDPSPLQDLFGDKKDVGAVAGKLLGNLFNRKK